MADVQQRANAQATRLRPELNTAAHLWHSLPGRPASWSGVTVWAACYLLPADHLQLVKSSKHGQLTFLIVVLAGISQVAASDSACSPCCSTGHCMVVTVHVSGWHCSLPAAVPCADRAVLPRTPPSRGSAYGSLVWSNLGTSREVMGSRGGDRLKLKVRLVGNGLCLSGAPGAAFTDWHSPAPAGMPLSCRCLQSSTLFEQTCKPFGGLRWLPGAVVHWIECSNVGCRRSQQHWSLCLAHGLSMSSAGALPVTGSLACPVEPQQQQSRPVLEWQSERIAAAEGEAAHCASTCSVRQASCWPRRHQRSQPCNQPWAPPA